MSIRLIVLIFLVSGGTTADLFAQSIFSRFGSGASEGASFEDEIETDRDSFTPAVSTVGRGRIVIESAYTFIDNRDVPETHSFPELLTRYGLNDWAELRIGTNYEVGGASNPVSGNVPDNLADTAELEHSANVNYGLKLDLLDQAGFLPDIAIMANGFTPTSGEETATDVASTLILGWRLANEWELDAALRYSTGSAEEDDFNVWAPSTALKIPVGERWKAHVEYFGIFSDGRAEETEQHFISPGAHYLFTPNFELGTRFGWGLNDQSPNFFVNVGGGIRF